MRARRLRGKVNCERGMWAGRCHAPQGLQRQADCYLIAAQEIASSHPRGKVPFPGRITPRVAGGATANVRCNCVRLTFAAEHKKGDRPGPVEAGAYKKCCPWGSTLLLCCSHHLLVGCPYASWPMPLDLHISFLSSPSFLYPSLKSLIFLIFLILFLHATNTFWTWIKTRWVKGYF